MAGINTPNLQLYKANPVDFVNISTDLNANYDKIDTALGNTMSGPSCILRKTSILSVPNNGDFMVNGYTNVDKNDSVGGNAMWVGGSSGQIVIRKTGPYDVGFKGLFATNSTGIRVCYLTLNAVDSGVGILNSNTVAMDSTDPVGQNTAFGSPVNCNAPAFLSVGDVLRAVVFQNSGAALNLDPTTNTGPLKFWAIWCPNYLGV